MEGLKWTFLILIVESHEKVTKQLLLFLSQKEVFKTR